MTAFEHYSDAYGRQVLCYRISHLVRESFLNLQTFCEYINESREFG